MNGKRKGLATAASIISIVSSILMVFGALFVFLVGEYITEDTFIETYRSDEEYVYVENPDGSYYFIDYDGFGEEPEIVKESEIEMLATTTKIIVNAFGVVEIAFAIIKLIMSITNLVSLGKNNFKLGKNIGLMVVNFLNFNLLEGFLLVGALCSKNRNYPDVVNTNSNNTQY